MKDTGGIQNEQTRFGGHGRRYGSRYGGLKQVDPVGSHGQLIIDYSIYDARRAGFETVIFVIKHEIEDTFKTAIGNRLSRVIDVKYACQQLDDIPKGLLCSGRPDKAGALPRHSGGTQPD